MGEFFTSNSKKHMEFHLAIDKSCDYLLQCQESVQGGTGKSPNGCYAK